MKYHNLLPLPFSNMPPKIRRLFLQEIDDSKMSWSGMTVISEAAASNERIQHQHVSSTTSRPPLRTPDHYEMIDQIGKGTF